MLSLEGAAAASSCPFLAEAQGHCTTNLYIKCPQISRFSKSVPDQNQTEQHAYLWSKFPTPRPSVGLICLSFLAAVYMVISDI